jgi:UDP-3-O-[3-hydroxymyristoyl] glucosamine N-acyltransferase
MTIGELVERLGGRLVQGDPRWEVSGISTIERARTFELVFAESAAAVTEALACKAGMIVKEPGPAQAYPRDKCIIEADQPRLWFAGAAKLLADRLMDTGIHATATVPSDVFLAPGVVVGPGVVIGSHARFDLRTRIDAGAVIGEGVEIGAHCHIYPRVVIYPGTKLGDRVVVHAGAVLGADGFGYVRDDKTGAYTQFPQQGTLVIEDDVEIGANSTIDRGALEETRIRRGTKIDNLVHVGHNCDIGEDVILVALTGISGSCTVGKGAVIAGQVGIGEHAHIGPGVILGGQAGVLSGKTVTNEGLKPGTVLWGTPARPLRQVLREQATLSRLARRPGKATEPAKE